MVVVKGVAVQFLQSGMGNSDILDMADLENWALMW